MLRNTKLRGCENSLSHLIITSLREAYQDPGKALLSPNPVSAIFEEKDTSEHGDGGRRSDDLNLHDRMQGRSKKQGMRGDLQAFFPLPCAMCKTKAKKVG